VITHPLVASQKRTSGACPEQYEGQLTDGRWFYFRYRFGWATLGLGPNIDTAVDNAHRSEGVGWGDKLQGEFDSTEDCTNVFSQLLVRRLNEEATRMTDPDTYLPDTYLPDGRLSYWAMTPAQRTELEDWLREHGVEPTTTPVDAAITPDGGDLIIEQYSTRDGSKYTLEDGTIAKHAVRVAVKRPLPWPRRAEASQG
jgi:hypothetical protein